MQFKKYCWLLLNFLLGVVLNPFPFIYINLVCLWLKEKSLLHKWLCKWSCQILFCYGKILSYIKNSDVKIHAKNHFQTKNFNFFCKDLLFIFNFLTSLYAKKISRGFFKVLIFSHSKPGWVALFLGWQVHFYFIQSSLFMIERKKYQTNIYP